MDANWFEQELTETVTRELNNVCITAVEGHSSEVLGRHPHLLPHHRHHHHHQVAHDDDDDDNIGQGDAQLNSQSNNIKSFYHSH